MNYPHYKPETLRALQALSVADSCGENEMKILPPSEYKAGNVRGERGLGDECRPWTDDTHMAIGVTRTLFRFNEIDQLELAKEFSRNFMADRQRGYGKGTAHLLTLYSYDVEDWKQHSSTWWQGPTGFTGSHGNGAPMRDSIIGAHFGLDLSKVSIEARKSAEVTHYHDTAIAGSIAVALAACVATYGSIDDFWPTILRYVPAGELRNRIEWVSMQNMQRTSNWDVVREVGNGKNVTTLDTVPYALWEAHYALFWRRPFMEGIDSIIEVGGDTDTVAAMYGGIIGNIISPPADVINITEPLPEDLRV